MSISTQWKTVTAPNNNSKKPRAKTSSGPLEEINNKDGVTKKTNSSKVTEVPTTFTTTAVDGSYDEDLAEEEDYYSNAPAGEVDKLLGKRSRKGKIEYKVLWLGYDESDPEGTSWESQEDLLFEGYAREVAAYDRKEEFEKRAGKEASHAERQQKIAIKNAIKEAEDALRREQVEADEYEVMLINNLFGGGWRIPWQAKMIPKMRIFVAHGPHASSSDASSYSAFSFYSQPNLVPASPLDLVVQRLEGEFLRLPFLLQAGGFKSCMWFSNMPVEAMVIKFLGEVNSSTAKKLSAHPPKPETILASDTPPFGGEHADEDDEDNEVSMIQNHSSSPSHTISSLNDSSDVLEMIFSFVPGKHFLLICSSLICQRWNVVGRRMKSARAAIRHILKELTLTCHSTGYKIQTLQLISPTTPSPSSSKDAPASPASSYDLQFLRSVKEDRRLERMGHYDLRNGSTEVAACILLQKDQINGSASFVPFNFDNLRSQIGGGKNHSPPVTIYLVRIPVDVTAKWKTTGISRASTATTDATHDGHGTISIWESDRVVLPPDGGDPAAPTKPIFGKRSSIKRDGTSPTTATNSSSSPSNLPPLAIPLLRIGVDEFIREDGGDSVLGTIPLFRDLLLGVNPFLKEHGKIAIWNRLQKRASNASFTEQVEDEDENTRLPCAEWGKPELAMLVKDLTHSSYLKQWISDAKRVVAALPPAHVLPASSPHVDLEEHRDTLYAIRFQQPWLSANIRKNEMVGEEFKNL